MVFLGIETPESKPTKRSRSLLPVPKVMMDSPCSAPWWQTYELRSLKNCWVIKEYKKKEHQVSHQFSENVAISFTEGKYM